MVNIKGKHIISRIVEELIDHTDLCSFPHIDEI